jgi:predicted acetylornithine/succinylornithine family transaminase
MNGIIERGKKYLMNTYGRYPIVLERGEGMYVWDAEGKRYLDFMAGIATNSLGHNDAVLAAAIAKQAARLIHCSNFFWTEPMVDLAEKLITNSCFGKAFFCNSGAEAIEGSLKLVKKYGAEKGKYEIITMENSFHGRTYGALTATGQEKYQKGFAPLLPNIKYVPFNNFGALEAAVSAVTAGIYIEPVQGEGGIIPADKEYLERVRKLCDENDILLVFDEIQCGIGRTGKLFAFENYGVAPDAVALAKGIAGGVPMGVLLAAAKAADVLQPGEHGTTFGGNPLAACAANTVLDRLLDGGLLENAAKQSEYLTAKLAELKTKFGVITEVRGMGLMQGIVLSVPAADVTRKCLENGLLLVAAGANVVRFVPALVLGREHIDECMAILENALLSE